MNHPTLVAAAAAANNETPQMKGVLKRMTVSTNNHDGDGDFDGDSKLQHKKQTDDDDEEEEVYRVSPLARFLGQLVREKNGLLFVNTDKGSLMNVTTTHDMLTLENQKIKAAQSLQPKDVVFVADDARVQRCTKTVTATGGTATAVVGKSRSHHGPSSSRWDAEYSKKTKTTTTTTNINNNSSSSSSSNRRSVQSDHGPRSVKIPPSTTVTKKTVSSSSANSLQVTNRPKDLTVTTSSSNSSSSVPSTQSNNRSRKKVSTLASTTTGGTVMELTSTSNELKSTRTKASPSPASTVSETDRLILPMMTTLPLPPPPPPTTHRASSNSSPILPLRACSPPYQPKRTPSGMSSASSSVCSASTSSFLSAAFNMSVSSASVSIPTSCGSLSIDEEEEEEEDDDIDEQEGQQEQAYQHINGLPPKDNHNGRGTAIAQRSTTPSPTIEIEDMQQQERTVSTPRLPPHTNRLVPFTSPKKSTFTTSSSSSSLSSGIPSIVESILSSPPTLLKPSLNPSSSLVGPASSTSTDIASVAATVVGAAATAAAAAAAMTVESTTTFHDSHSPSLFSSCSDTSNEQYVIDKTRKKDKRWGGSELDARPGAPMNNNNNNNNNNTRPGTNNNDGTLQRHIEGEIGKNSSSSGESRKSSKSSIGGIGKKEGNLPVSVNRRRHHERKKLADSITSNAKHAKDIAPTTPSRKGSSHRRKSCSNISSGSPTSPSRCKSMPSSVWSAKARSATINIRDDCLRQSEDLNFYSINNNSTSRRSSSIGSLRSSSQDRSMQIVQMKDSKSDHSLSSRHTPVSGRPQVSRQRSPTLMNQEWELAKSRQPETAEERQRRLLDKWRIPPPKKYNGCKDSPCSSPSQRGDRLSQSAHEQKRQEDHTSSDTRRRRNSLDDTLTYHTALHREQMLQQHEPQRRQRCSSLDDADWGLELERKGFDSFVSIQDSAYTSSSGTTTSSAGYRGDVDLKKHLANGRGKRRTGRRRNSTRHAPNGSNYHQDDDADSKEEEQDNDTIDTTQDVFDAASFFKRSFGSMVSASSQSTASSL